MEDYENDQAKKFHHGNLREELIEAGHAALNESGVGGVSLRTLAQRAGVSQSAPYRHFASKEALLQELIDGGLNELLVAYEAAADLEVSPTERLRAACNAYLDFAANRRGLFQLIFENNGSFSATSVESGDEAPSFVLFVELVRDAAPMIPKGKELDAAILCWSVIHGFGALFSHGEIPAKADEVWLRNAAIEAAVSAVSNVR